MNKIVLVVLVLSGLVSCKRESTPLPDAVLALCGDGVCLPADASAVLAADVTADMAADVTQEN